MAFSRDDAPSGEQTSATTIPDPTNSTSSPRVTTPPFALPTDFDPIELNPLPTVATTTTVFDSGAGQIFPDTQLGLYIAIDDNNARLLRLDLATGTVAKVERQSRGRVRALLPGPSGPIFIDDSIVGFEGWNVVVSPDGTIWGPANNGVSLVQFDAEGQRLRTVNGPATSIFNGAIAGVTADGRPVVLGPDARAYAINPDDTYERVGEGFVTKVQPGGYWEVICDVAAACHAVIHGVDQRPFSIDASELDLTTAISVSPSGRLAMVTVGEGLSVIDLATGVRTEVPGAIPFGEQYGFFGHEPALWYGTGDQFLVFPSKGNLAVYDTTTGELRTVLMPLGSVNEVLLGFAP
jgi:hypothetical protein